MAWHLRPRLDKLIQEARLCQVTSKVNLYMVSNISYNNPLVYDVYYIYTVFAYIHTY